MRRWSTGIAAAALAVLPMAPAARAEEPPLDTRPAALRDVGFDQRLGAQVPLDAVLRDETGAQVTLGGLLGEKPAILAMVYYECPMLCTLVLNGLVSAMNALPFAAGEEFDVIAISIDPRETPAMAAAKKETYLGHYRRPNAAAGWHFLTGDEAEVARIAQAIGFRYTFLPERDEYAHAAGITVLTPQGRVARYFYGVEYAPRDLRFGLIEASENRIGSPVDQLMLYCFQYDPTTGRYSTAVLSAVRAGVLTVAAFAAFFIWSRRRERAARPQAPADALRPGTQPALPGRLH